MLPCDKFDDALVLLARGVLRKDTDPMLPVGRDLDTALLGGEPHFIDPSHDNDMGGYLIDDVGILQIAGDP